MKRREFIINLLLIMLGIFVITVLGRFIFSRRRGGWPRYGPSKLAG